MLFTHCDMFTAKCLIRINWFLIYCSETLKTFCNITPLFLAEIKIINCFMCYWSNWSKIFFSMHTLIAMIAPSCQLWEHAIGTKCRKEWKIIYTVGHKKEPTCFCLWISQKWTDFNAVFTVRFLNEWHVWRLELHLPHLINDATLPCESWKNENACEHNFSL